MEGIFSLLAFAFFGGGSLAVGISMVVHMVDKKAHERLDKGFQKLFVICAIIAGVSFTLFKG